MRLRLQVRWYRFVRGEDLFDAWPGEPRRGVTVRRAARIRPATGRLMA